MNDGVNFNSTSVGSSFVTPHHNRVSAHSNQQMASKFDDFVDMEISNSVDNPNSMFQSALPSLKLNTDSKLNNEQMNMLERKRNEIQENLRQQDNVENFSRQNSSL